VNFFKNKKGNSTWIVEVCEVVAGACE